MRTSELQSGWRDVFVHRHVVESDDFEASVGDLVSMPFELACTFRQRVQGSPVHTVMWTAGDSRHPDNRGRYEIVGRVLPIEGCAWTDGLMIEVEGLAMYVANDLREQGTEPMFPVPLVGSSIRVRGQLGIAESYVTGGYEPEDDLLRRAEREWRVRRIVPTAGSLAMSPPPAETGVPIDAIRRRHVPMWVAGYPLDLQEA